MSEEPAPYGKPCEHLWATPFCGVELVFSTCRLCGATHPGGATRESVLAALSTPAIVAMMEQEAAGRDAATPCEHSWQVQPSADDPSRLCRTCDRCGKTEPLPGDDIATIESAPRRPPWPSDPRARPILGDAVATLTLALPLDLSLRLAHEAAERGLGAEAAAVELIEYALRLREQEALKKSCGHDWQDLPMLGGEEPTARVCVLCGAYSSPAPRAGR